MAITNGGFESGTTGWTITLAGSGAANVISGWTGDTYTYSPQDGSNLLQLVTTPSTTGSRQKCDQDIACLAGEIIRGYAGLDCNTTSFDRAQVIILSGVTIIDTPLELLGGSYEFTSWSWTCPADGTYKLSLRSFKTSNSLTRTYALFDKIELVPVGVGVSITPAQLALALAFNTPTVSTTGQHITPAQLALTGTFQTPTLKVGHRITPVQKALALAFNTPSIINRTLATIANLWMTTHYRLTLTGAQDSTTDTVLPMSSFLIRYDYDPYRVYLSAIIPGVDSVIDAIEARPNGRLIITRIYTYLAGATDEHEMVNVVYDTLNTNEGGRAGTTGTIGGFENLSYLSPETITLTSPVTRTSESGRRRYRCAIDPRVRPGDTVIINNETFVVSTVLYIIDSKTAIMEVQELL